MKKIIMVVNIIIIAALILTAGCGINQLSGDPDITGIIYSTGEQRILVVEGIQSAGVPYEEWSGNGLRAIYFRVTPNTVIVGEEEQTISYNELYTGQKVDVWITGPVAESYPEQAEAKKIIVHP